MAPSSSDGECSDSDNSSTNSKSQKSSNATSSDSDTDSEAVVLLKSTRKQAKIPPAYKNRNATTTPQNKGTRRPFGSSGTGTRQNDKSASQIPDAEGADSSKFGGGNKLPPAAVSLPPEVETFIGTTKSPALTVTNDWFGKYKDISTEHVRNQIMLLGHADVTDEQVHLSKKLMIAHRALARDHGREVVESMMVAAAQAEKLTWNTQLVTKVNEVRDWWASAGPDEVHTIAHTMYKIQQLPFENEVWSRTAELDFLTRHSLAVQSKPGVRNSGRSCFRALMTQAKTDVTKAVTKKAKEKTHGFYISVRNMRRKYSGNIKARRRRKGEYYPDMLMNVRETKKKR